MAMTPEARQFAFEMTKAPGRTPIAFAALPACDCGCGRPARISITLAGATISIVDAPGVDALIDLLIEGREKLWGPKS